MMIMLYSWYLFFQERIFAKICRIHLLLINNYKNQDYSKNESLNVSLSCYPERWKGLDLHCIHVFITLKKRNNKRWLFWIRTFKMWVSHINFQRQLFLDTQSCYVTCCVLFPDKGKRIHVMITILIHSWLNFCILYYLVKIQDSGSQYSMLQGICWSSWLWYFQECYWLDICTVYLLVRFSLPC